MARKSIDDVSDRRGMTDLGRRHVRRDLAVNGVLAAVTGSLSFAIMPPPGLAWPVELQLAIASGIALVVFAVAAALLITLELRSGVR